MELKDTCTVDGCVYDDAICVTTEGTAWVGLTSGVMSEIDRVGRLTRSLQVSYTGAWCTSITTTDDGWLVACSDGDINRVSRDGHVWTWATTTFKPWGITSVSADQVLVCGARDGLFIVTRQGEQRVDLGVEWSDIVDVATNKQGDVAVTDCHKGQVVIVDVNYKHLARYNGDQRFTEKFSPEGISSDGNIFIVCDPDNQKIHFIDRSGVCLFVYQTPGNFSQKEPWRVSMMPGSCLWVMFDDGYFCVYDLMLT